LSEVCVPDEQDIRQSDNHLQKLITTKLAVAHLALAQNQNNYKNCSTKGQHKYSV